MKKPNFFIVGAPKCGTTSMSTYLSQHPEIFIAEKDLHFFASDLIHPWRDIEKPEEKYISYFANAGDEKRLGDASVWCLYSKTAAYSIKEFCPSAKIIIMLRNPIDMLYSYYNFFYRLGKEDISDFKAALEAEPERKRGKRLPQWLYNNDVGEFFPIEGLFYREVVKYTLQVQRYFDCFGRDNVRVIIFDDFKTNTTESYRQTLAFLGVNENFQPEFQVNNPGKQRRVRSQTLRNIVKNPVSIWLVKTLIPRPGEGYLSKLLTLWYNLNNHYEPISPMNEKLKNQLKNEFIPEVEALSELLNRDLTIWCR